MSRYEEIRGQIKSGDVIALSHYRWGSWYDLQVMAVRLGQISEYCHIGVAWVVGNRVFIIHAIGAGVSITPLSHELPFYWIPTDGEWTDEVEEFALSKVGQAYSKWQAIKAFLGQLKAGEDDQWECGEFANIVVAMTGLPVNPKSLTPSTLVRDLQTLNKPVYFVAN